MNLTVPEIESREHERNGRGVTDVRWRLGAGRTPKQRKERRQGSVLLGWAGWLLAILGAGVLAVSFAGQYQYILFARHQHIAALIEAGMLDVGMIIFTLLALALSRMGKPAKTERALIVATAIGSAGMNYAAADAASFRSVLAYTAAPIFLAVVVDRLVAVIRRHVLGDEEPSAWSGLGTFTLGCSRLVVLVLLYSLRFVLDARETGKGLRHMVLNAAPLPEIPAPVQAEVIELNPDDEDENPVTLPTKKDRLLSLYRGHESYGNRALASQVAAELAPFADLQAGTARTYLYDEIDRNRSLGSAS